MVPGSSGTHGVIWPRTYFRTPIFTHVLTLRERAQPWKSNVELRSTERALCTQQMHIVNESNAFAISAKQKKLVREGEGAQR